MQDPSNHKPFEPWHMGKDWQRERLQIGREYISWPQQRSLQDIRGRRCIFLGFEPATFGEGLEAKVRFADDDRIEHLSPGDLISAWLVGSPKSSQ